MASLVFFESAALRLSHRMMQILIECTIGMILAELMFLKMQKNEDEVMRSHLSQNKRARKLICAYKVIVFLIIMFTISLIVADHCLEL